jgi:hypothetical protein
MDQGNNIECLKTFRVNIPLNSTTGGKLANGIKYYFPELPIFKGKNIVGIDLNASSFSTSPGSYIVNGDLEDKTQVGTLINMEEARNIYLTIYSEDGQEKHSNLPLRSLFMVASAIGGLFPYGTYTAGKRVVKPLYGKINPRKSYAFLPVGTFAVKDLKYISLNFYYN